MVGLGVAFGRLGGRLRLSWMTIIDDLRRRSSVCVCVYLSSACVAVCTSHPAIPFPPCTIARTHKAARARPCGLLLLPRLLLAAKGVWLGVIASEGCSALVHRYALLWRARARMAGVGSGGLCRALRGSGFGR